MMLHSRRGSRSTASLARTTLAPLPSFPPPPAAPLPFVGREREQEQALHQLRECGVVAIRGGRGSGKTALSATVARDSGLPAAWIEILPGLNDRLEPFLWQLARPLAKLAPETWAALQQIYQSDWHYPAMIRLQIILEGYAHRQEETLVCIDGLEYVAEPALRSALSGLCDYVARTRYTRLKLLVAGRSLPYRVEQYALLALRGLAAPALLEWATACSFALSREQANEIATRTGGLPQVFALIIAAARGRGGFDPAIDLSQQEIRRFVSVLLADLTPDERALLERFAAQGNQAAALPRESMAQFATIEEQHLVEVSVGAVTVHPLIRDFYQRH